ncbi:hypothetical protein V5799_025377 [Amblyomma americanum]|uniref:PiggyBac transposable element-derived protein domain-containing protein n=1 Tax=Amblyomma americanum TaxID=6943 RepID=A0AAQ4E9F1_AMBAM
MLATVVDKILRFLEQVQCMPGAPVHAGHYSGQKRRIPASKKKLTDAEIDKLLDVPLPRDQVNALLGEDLPSGSDDDRLDSEDDGQNEVEVDRWSDITDSSASEEEDVHTDSDAEGEGAPKQRRIQKEKPEVWRWDKRDIPHCTKVHNELKPKAAAAEGKTPLKMFKLMYGEDLIELLTFESNRHRILNRPKMKVITKNEMEVFLGICMYMSIVDISFRRSYWSSNTRQDMVADAMTVNRWEEILSVLHLNDAALEKKSSEEGFDRLQKVRPMIDQLNASFKNLAEPESCQAIDE